ncbi:MAG TPA: hypothetical protein VKT72_15350, partial [Candidatus Baltobacteraceae bacterium]|nr:hypothetical protein [Candidatus Baltobacteraceae bacterium]
MTLSELADQRTLETLDFASVRERVVEQTRTERGRHLAEELAPFVDFERIKREQTATEVVRELIVSADLHVSAALDTADLTQRASVGTSLSATELRAVGDAVAAAAAAYNKTRDPSIPQGDKREVLEALTGGYQPLKEIVRAITDAIDER